MIQNINNFKNEIEKLKDSVENSFTCKPDDYYIIPDEFYKHATFLQMLREAFPNLTFHELPEFVFDEEHLAVEAVLFDGDFTIENSPILQNITRSKAALISYTKNKNFKKDQFLELVHLSLWNDKDFIFSLPPNVLSACVQFFSEDFLEDKEFVLKLAQISPSTIRYISDEMLKDKDIFIAYAQDSIQASLNISDEIFIEVFSNYETSLILLQQIEKQLQQNKTLNFYPKLCLFLNKLLNHPNYTPFIDIDDVLNKEEFNSDKSFKRFFHTGYPTFTQNFDFQNHFETLLDKIISKVNRELFKMDNKR